MKLIHTDAPIIGGGQTLGPLTLAAYVKPGMEHAPRADKRYVPSSTLLPPLQKGGWGGFADVAIAPRVATSDANPIVTSSGVPSATLGEIPPSPPFAKGGTEVDRVGAS